MYIFFSKTVHPSFLHLNVALIFFQIYRQIIHQVDQQELVGISEVLVVVNIF